MTAPPVTAERSPHWSSVRAAHLKTHGVCAACGGKDHLEVHHKQPFHKFPALELEPSNLITLCESPSHNCHFVHGHSLDWRGWNQHVDDDVAVFRSRVVESDKLAQRAA